MALQLLLVALFVLVLVLAALWPRRPAGGPPGPTPLPLIGTLAFAGVRDRTELFAVLLSLPRQFGDVVGFYAGCTYNVYVEGLAAARRAMVHPAANGRAAGSAQMALAFGLPRGVVVAEGERWASNSAFLFQTLEEMIASGEAEELISDELSELTGRLRQLDGQPADVQSLFRRVYVSLSWRLVTGRRFLAGQAERVTRLFQAAIAGFQNRLVDNRPLRWLFPERSGYADVLRFRDEVRRLFAAAVSAEDGEEGTFVARLRAQRGADWRPAADEDLVMFLFDFLNAGCETTSSFNEWSLLYLLREPAQRQTVCDELNALGRLATGADRQRLPRTRAFLAEVFRRSSLTPAGVPHRATAPLTIDGHHVPRDTVLRYGILATHWSDQLWEAPDQFRPERFLRAGQFEPSDNLAPYGVGPRCCTGRNLAELYNFITVSRLLQQFELAVPEGSGPPPEDTTIALSRNCLPFQAVFRPR